MSNTPDCNDKSTKFGFLFAAPVISCDLTWSRVISRDFYFLPKINILETLATSDENIFFYFLFIFDLFFIFYLFFIDFNFQFFIYFCLKINILTWSHVISHYLALSRVISCDVTWPLSSNQSIDDMDDIYFGMTLDDINNFTGSPKNKSCPPPSGVVAGEKSVCVWGRVLGGGGILTPLYF